MELTSTVNSELFLGFLFHETSHRSFFICPSATVSEVEFHDFTIPKDTMVLTHLESVHTDHNYWDNARELINGSI